jgi:hypothetical protein
MMRPVLRLLIAGLVCAGLALGCGEPNKGTVPKADSKLTPDVNANKGTKPTDQVPAPPGPPDTKKNG